jgi:phosphoglycolate phosphatase-like HAD superfamily hydrolase/ADP-ribose pyrophosphatase YjhB (NUDIX family)
VIRNIIFDWSGTLVDDLPAVWRATNHVFTRAGVREISLDEFRAEFCLPFQKFYDRYVPHVALPQLEDWFHGHFRTVQDLVEELPHARGFLQFCRAQRIRTFLLSTVAAEHFAVQAAATGFAEFLDKPYLGVWDKRQRIRNILDENALDPRETVFIGDMQHDIETAKHGGIHSIAVLTGYNRLHQLRASEPDLIVEHLGELREIFADNGFRLERRVNGYELAPHPISTVGALIFNGHGEVLMIRTQKWSGLWGIPGGKIKWGESSVDALRRELKEETALEVTDIRFVMVQDCIHSTEFYRDAHFILLNYTCRAQGALEVRLNEEAQEFRWLPPDAALGLNLNEPTRLLLQRVCHGANQPQS